MNDEKIDEWQAYGGLLEFFQFWVQPRPTHESWVLNAITNFVRIQVWDA